MIKEKIDDAKIKRICQNLKSEEIDKIDFDELIETLGAVRETINLAQKSEAELEYIKDEYKRRIIGMVKANLACRENESDSELAVRLANDKLSLGAEELVKMYGKAAARFRANFPASFKYLTVSSNRNSQKGNWDNYKI